MSDDKTDPVSIKMLFFLTSELDDAQVELLSTHAEQHSLAEVVKHIEDAKQEKSLDTTNSLDITDEQLELLRSYTQDHTFAEFIEHINVAKQARVLFQAV
jgi:hypothetical protein